MNFTSCKKKLAKLFAKIGHSIGSKKCVKISSLCCIIVIFEY